MRPRTTCKRSQPCLLSSPHNTLQYKDHNYANDVTNGVSGRPWLIMLQNSSIMLCCNSLSITLQSRPVLLRFFIYTQHAIPCLYLASLDVRWLLIRGLMPGRRINANSLSAFVDSNQQQSALQDYIKTAPMMQLCIT